ncbi:MAG: ABC transporter permease [Oligoflexales bacterium]
MLKFIVRRGTALIVTFFGVSILAFGLIRMVPGDPIMLLLGERGASPELYAEMKASLGLDKPLAEQYFIYITKALHGDLGTSILSKEPVLAEFAARFPATLELSIVALIFAVLLGIPIGAIAAIKRNSWIDYSVMGASLVGYSMPIFWWALILILFFSVNLGWTPVSGRIDIMFDVPSVTGFLLIDSWFSEEGVEAFFSALRYMILPAIALGTIPLAVISRMTRSSLLEVLGEDYIRAVRARGVSEWAAIAVHALRNALIPVVVVIGLMFGSLITGAILTETIFSWPGIGKWLLQSVTSRDYPVIQGGILLIAAMIIVVNFAVDLINMWINPKIRSLM